MSLLDMAYDEKTWAEFRQYRASHGNMTEKELAKLDEYIDQKRYLPTAQNLVFSLPEKKSINKSGSQKKRVIYTFPEDETWVLKLLTWLMYKYDSVFHSNCYSFRQEYTAHTAINDVLQTEKLDDKWALKLDLHNYFNSMPSYKLADEFSKVITDDKPLLDFLIRFFTLDNALSTGTVITENRGAMAGVPLSAFCANLYLTDLDKHFENAAIPYFRYSDDILILADTKQQAIEYYDLVKEHIEKKGLTLNEEKFSLTPPHEAWEFLGFSYFNGSVDLSQASIRKMKAKIKRKAAAFYRRKSKKALDGDKAARAMIKTFERKIYGETEKHDFTWSRWYFPVLTTDKGLHELDRYLVENIRFIYTGRHYKGNYRISYEHIRSLGFRSLVNEYYKYRLNK